MKGILTIQTADRRTVALAGAAGIFIAAPPPSTTGALSHQGNAFVASQYETLLVDNLALVERVAAALARRHQLGREDARDFTAWIKLRLLENDYAILRKFRGESKIGTYLTVAIAMLARDYRAEHWGRWRPSVAAQRIGSIAVQLETMVYRDGLQVTHAGELLRTAGKTFLSDTQLAHMLARLPSRSPLRPVKVDSEMLAGLSAQKGADSTLEEQSSRDERRNVEDALESAVGLLPPDDRVVLRMHFWEGMTVAEIARSLSIEQKPLYKRFDRLLGSLKKSLIASGLNGRHVSALVEEHS
jgi:RNA polymerase sigma factor (sigma-70 family)